MPSADHVPLAGTERQPLAWAEPVADVAPDERIDVTVLLRERAALPSLADTEALLPRDRRPMSREEFAAAHGASTDDVAAVEAFAHENDLDVMNVSLEQRTVALSGTASALSAAFGVKLAVYQHAAGRYRGRTGPVNVPADLEPIVQAVLGLDDRPQARPQFRLVPDTPALAARAAATSGPRPYAPTEVAALYDFPAGTDGTGQNIGLIELGGGFRPADLKAYFKSLGAPLPRVSAVSVDGGRNTPGGPDGEVMLDIEVAGAVAPGAGIVVYFAPNSARGFLDAVLTAVHDTAHRPSVISISWGMSEGGWTAAAMQAMDQAFQAAATMGITVCAAAGDNGSADGVADGAAHTDFPASSPHALACGGTRLDSSGSTYTGEVVWNDGPGQGSTGGGISDVFDVPRWQGPFPLPKSVNGGRAGRGVPDVSGDADPVSGYKIRVDGRNVVIGGTSAVAPLWAALLARVNQHLGTPVGFVNPLLYGLVGTAAFRDVTSGDNGGYHAGTGWDACTGLGSPDGAALSKALGGS